MAIGGTRLGRSRLLSYYNKCEQNRRRDAWKTDEPHGWHNHQRLETTRTGLSHVKSASTGRYLTSPNTSEVDDNNVLTDGEAVAEGRS